MRKPLFLLLFLIGLNQLLLAQTKLVLDFKVMGGVCTDYFDLGENGFVMQFTKTQNADLERDKKSGKLNISLYYFSKDLVKRATIKEQIYGELKILSNTEHLVLLDKLGDAYAVHLFTYDGRKVRSMQVNLAEGGLSASAINRVYFSSTNQLLFEVIDLHQNTHLFVLNTLDKNTQFIEADIPLPSSNPLATMQKLSKWMFLQEMQGYYIFYRQGTNAEYNATSAAFHLAFYNEKFELYRELLIDKVLFPNQYMLCKNMALNINPSVQTIEIAATIFANNKPTFLAAAFGIDPSSTVMKNLWRNEIPVMSKGRYQIIENDPNIIPLSPQIYNTGNITTCMGLAGRATLAEENVNQFMRFDRYGKVIYNNLQKGNLDKLNLDAFCVDADNMYERIMQLKMGSTLKTFCEQVNMEVLDIYVSDNGQELAVLRNNAKKESYIYKF